MSQDVDYSDADSGRRTQSMPALLAACQHDIDVLQQLLDRQACNLRQACSPSGEFEAALLDTQQQNAYDLALCHASLEAVKVMREFALRAQATELDQKLAGGFIAETVDGLLQKLSRFGDEFWQEIHALRSSGVLGDVLQLGLAPEYLAAIGAQLLEQQLAGLSEVLDSEKRMVRETFARFAREEVAPLAEQIHRQDLDIPESLLRRAAELGSFGTCIPQRFGGLQPDEGGDSLSMIVVTEALSSASLGAAGSLITRPEIAARALLAGGTQAQQAHWLPRLASGASLCAIAITEPDTGSDVAAVSLRARPVAGGWLLNGAKTWCTFAGRSELLVVLARSSEKDSPIHSGHRGLSLFLVEKPAFSGHAFSFRQQGEHQGELSGKAIATLGYRGMHSYDLVFSDFFVPADNLVGAEQGVGKGFYYTMAGFAGGRIQTAARANGVMQAAFDQALQYCQQRKAFGQTLGDFQLTRIKLVRMLATLTACRLFSYRVATLLDRGEGQMAASLVKLFACRAAEWVTREAMQLHGGMGYAEETAVSRYFVDARVLSIFEGAEEVLAVKVVAKELIEHAVPPQANTE